MSTTNLTNSSSDPQLPTESPPLPPGLPNQNQSASNPLNTTQIAPTVGTLPASYQNYYQYQYMQYYQQYMYSHPTIMQSYGMMPPAQPTAPNYYNYNPAPSQQVAPKQTAQSLTAPQVPPNAASQQKSSILIEEQKSSASNETPKPAIKINLKYQQGSNTNQIHSSVSSPLLSTSVETSSDKITPRKSRFDDKVSNVTSQQKKFEQQQKEIESKEKEKETKTDASKNEGISSKQTNSDNIATSSQSEIVFDIHKWPVALKNYCAKGIIFWFLFNIIL